MNPIHLAIRGFAGRRKVFEDRITAESMEALRALLPLLAERHGAALAAHELHMLEIEFLDELDPAQRFFRFGTDPAGMLQPIKIRLD